MSITWKEGAPREFHKDIAAIGLGHDPDVIVFLRCSPGRLPELLATEVRGRRPGRLYSSRRDADHAELERLIPRAQWPHSCAKGCGWGVDPLPRRIARKHEHAYRRLKRRNRQVEHMSTTSPSG